MHSILALSDPPTARLKKKNIEPPAFFFPPSPHLIPFKKARLSPLPVATHPSPSSPLITTPQSRPLHSQQMKFHFQTTSSLIPPFPCKLLPPPRRRIDSRSFLTLVTIFICLICQLCLLSLVGSRMALDLICISSSCRVAFHSVNKPQGASTKNNF